MQPINTKSYHEKKKGLKYLYSLLDPYLRRPEFLAKEFESMKHSNFCRFALEEQLD